MPHSNVDSDYDYNERKWVVSLINSAGEESSVPSPMRLLGGHAVIIVEGLNEGGTIFQGEYDIQAKIFPNDQEDSCFGNSQGAITQIRCNPTPQARANHPNNTVKFHRNYSKKASCSWYTMSDLALEMIASIEEDSNRILEAIEGGVQKLKEDEGEPRLREVFKIAVREQLINIDVDELPEQEKMFNQYLKERAFPLTEWPFPYQMYGAHRWSILGGNGGDNCVTWAEEKLSIAEVGNGKMLKDSKKAFPEKHVNLCAIL